MGFRLLPGVQAVARGFRLWPGVWRQSFGFGVVAGVLGGLPGGRIACLEVHSLAHLDGMGIPA